MTHFEGILHQFVYIVTVKTLQGIIHDIIYDTVITNLFKSGDFFFLPIFVYSCY